MPGRSFLVGRKLKQAWDAGLAEEEGHQVSISPSAYTVYAIHQTNLKSGPAHAYSVLRTSASHNADTAVHTLSDYQPDMSALPADIGLPKPCNVMPDPSLVNPDWASTI